MRLGADEGLIVLLPREGGQPACLSQSGQAGHPATLAASRGSWEARGSARAASRATSATTRTTRATADPAEATAATARATAAATEEPAHATEAKADANEPSTRAT